MHEKIQEIIHITKEKFGLYHYYLKEYHFYRNVNMFNKTVYGLSMEWFPENVVQEEEDVIPDGTASINFNLKSHQYEQVIFVNDQSYAVNGIIFTHYNQAEIIKWVENHTGLIYKEHFQLKKEKKGEFLITACMNGVDIAPSGYIDIKINQDGKLTLFSIHGSFPLREQVEEEEYALSLDNLDFVKREQLKMIEYPIYEQKKLDSIYVIEELFIENDGISTIPFEYYSVENNGKKLDETLYWHASVEKPFKRNKINWTEDISIEQVLSKEPSPDSRPITNIEQDKCILAIRNLLAQEYPNESGHWVVKFLYRDKGYIQAVLKTKIQNYCLFQRKMKVIIDSNSLQVVNYMDSKPILETFDQFELTDQVTITIEEAYEKLKGYIELKPYYVYDITEQKYILCGKVDCRYGVNASTGEVILL
jgi:hypothetical protein